MLGMRTNHYSPKDLLLQFLEPVVVSHVGTSDWLGQPSWEMLGCLLSIWELALDRG